MFAKNPELRLRLRQLEQHLREENPLLVDAVRHFRQLDRVAWKLGLLPRDQSYAAQIPWWPLIAVLGTFSAGKSTFINQYLEQALQATGNQAVDDKFTVICYSPESEPRVLPGVALDADPRFPFYQISEELEKVAPGEGARVDAYLQLKTGNHERLKGQILIDSPGFDADSQRTAILRLTDYIIDLSDLVLVFFDARHPEPGAMQDTLRHLVGGTIHRHDSSKFLYILNQIDTTAGEDNPEDVVGAWQRALAQEGLTAGRFYTLYDPDAAVPIADPALQARYARKAEQDRAAVHARMADVRVERAYRIIDSLEKRARDLLEVKVPRLQQLRDRWLRATLWRDGFLWLLVFALLGGGGMALGGWQDGLRLPSALMPYRDEPLAWITGGGLLLFLILGVHGLARRWAAASVLRHLRQAAASPEEAEQLARAFARNTRWWHSVFRPRPVGWSRRARRRLERIIAAADRQIQALNDRFTRPSGETGEPPLSAGEEKAKTETETPPASEEQPGGVQEEAAR